MLNSVAIAGLIPSGVSVADVGTGAGLPGIPLAIARPDLRVTLIESLLRRVNFLELTVAELGLTDRVTVVRARAEEHRGSYDVVTSRAVAAFPKLLEWCLPLVSPAGAVLALKGETAAQELADASAILKRRRLVATVHELPVLGSPDPTWAMEVRRVS